MRSRKLTSGVSFCLVLLLLAMSLVMECSLPTLSPPQVVEAESAVEPEPMSVVELGPESRDLLLIPILELGDITEGVNFELIDQHALDAPEWAEESVESLAAYLIEPAQNDLEKVRAIFRWITHNITYDREGLRTGVRGDQSAEGALASRKVVCEGYSRLFKALAHLAGLLEIPITREEFTELPLVWPSFFRYNLEPISHLRPTIKTRHSITITISAPEDIQLSAVLEQEDQRLPRELTFVQREEKRYIIEAVFPDPGDYCLIIFSLLPEKFAVVRDFFGK